MVNALESQHLSVSYPAVDDEYARDFDAYFLQQLKLALDKSGVAYALEPQRMPTFVESRSAYNLAHNRYTVHWMNTNTKRETSLYPVRVPLFKGLIGWRLFLIPESKQPLFDNITTLDQLKKLAMSQGHDWPDTQLLKKNGFRLEISTQWKSLFKMLALERTDYFPRSVIEIWREQRIFADLPITIERKNALQYRSAYYFFVNKKNVALAQALEKGLAMAIEDGSFDRNFREYFGELIAKARFEQRQIFHIENTTIKFPSDPALWFDPTTDQP